MASNRKPYGMPYQRAMKRHAKQCGLKAGPARVLDALLGYCNGMTGQSRPGRKLILEECGCSERSLDTHLKTLRDMELIVPIAYAQGGRNRATVYAFALPAWSGQDMQKTPANIAEESSEDESKNPRNFFQKPPQVFPKTPASFADPTERTERTEEEAGAASRGQPSRANPNAPENPIETALFDEWLKVGDYGSAVQKLREWRAGQAVGQIA